MATLQNDGRIGDTEAFVNLPIFIAWGRGDPDWDETPEPEPINATALEDEVGRRLATQVQFVVPDEEGEIELPSARYSVSAEPSKWAHVRVVFDFEDAVGETIREIGVYYSSVPVEGLPSGLRYFTPEQIAEQGRLKVLHRLANPIVREGGVRQTFEYVLPF